MFLEIAANVGPTFGISLFPLGREGITIAKVIRLHKVFYEGKQPADLACAPRVYSWAFDPADATLARSMRIWGRAMTELDVIIVESDY